VVVSLTRHYQSCILVMGFTHLGTVYMLLAHPPPPSDTSHHRPRWLVVLHCTLNMLTYGFCDLPHNNRRMFQDVDEYPLYTMHMMLEYIGQQLKITSKWLYSGAASPLVQPQCDDGYRLRALDLSSNGIPEENLTNVRMSDSRSVTS